MKRSPAPKRTLKRPWNSIDWTWTKLATVLAVIAVGLAAGLWIRDTGLGRRLANQQSREQPASAASPRPTATPRPASYSLTIPSQRVRDYPGSAVTVETPLEPADGYRRQTVSYLSDGLKDYAQVTLPAGRTPSGGYPAVVLVHGYVQPSGYVTDEEFYSGIAATYARQGFAVIKPDLRGHGRSWGVPEGAYFSAGYGADVLNLAASLRGFTPVDATRLTLLGHSMGGRVALDVAVVRPEAFEAVVLASGSVARLSDTYANWTAFSDFGDPVTLGYRRRVISLFGEPAEGNAFWREADPYTYLGDLTAPVLIAHTPEDDTVPYRFSESLDAALTAAGKPHTFTAYSGGHSFLAAADTPFTPDATAFLRTALKLPAGGSPATPATRNR